MKIKENVTIIELTFTELRDDLENYQADMLQDLIACELGKNPSSERLSQFAYKLLTKGEFSDWFQDLIEKHGIHWLSSPSNDDEMIELILSYPMVFRLSHIIEDHMDNNTTADNFDIRIEGRKLDSETIINNI